MLQLTGAGKRFGPKLLFENLDWLITPKERVGLVGGNGTGKSTLLKILAGLDSLDYGSLTSMKGIRIGYLPQDGLSMTGRTVFGECMSVFSGLLEMERELETLTSKMSELDPAGPEYSQVAERFSRIDGEFRARDGYALDAQVGRRAHGPVEVVTERFVAQRQDQDHDPDLTDGDPRGAHRTLSDRSSCTTR